MITHPQRQQTSIVLTICAKHNIAPDVFFGPSRSPRLSKCRQDAMLALHAAGFSYAEIGRLTRRDTSSVIYWVNSEYRERQRKQAQLRRRAA